MFNYWVYICARKYTLMSINIYKKVTFISMFSLLIGVSLNINAQSNEWVWDNGSSSINQNGVYGTQGLVSTSNVPGSRQFATAQYSSAGDAYVFGGFGNDGIGSNGLLNDLWKYDGTNWTWMKGNNTINNSGTYGTMGTAAPANSPGSRWSSVSWIDNSGNFWVFGGQGFDAFGSFGRLNDLWKYDGTNWTWVSGSNSVNTSGTYGSIGVAAAANTPGARRNAVTWTDNSGNLYLFGGEGYGNSSFIGNLNDLWKFDGTNWTWVSGSNAINATSSYGTLGTAASSNVPGSRTGSVSWLEGTDLYLFGGYGKATSSTNGYLNDLWKWDGSNWTWMSGDNSTNKNGIYGTQNVVSTSNKPGSRMYSSSWVDDQGFLWLNGGFGRDKNGSTNYLNDLWRWDGTSWTWASGSDVVNQGGTYGTMGTFDAANAPGARRGAAYWKNGTGEILMFAGGGYDGSSTFGEMNDLWRFAIEPLYITIANGDWENPAIWLGGAVPIATSTATVRHKVNIKTSTGDVTVKKIIIHNTVADAELRINEGRTLTVTENLCVIGDNYSGNHSFLLVNDGDVNIASVLDVQRTPTNTFSNSTRIRVNSGSSISCDSMVWNNAGTGSSSGDEIELNDGRISIVKDFVINSSAPGDFNLDMNNGQLDIQDNFISLMTGANGSDINITLDDSSVIKIGNGFIHQTSGGEDFTMTLNDSSSIEVTNENFWILSSGLGTTESMNVVFNDKSIGNFNGPFRITHSSGDDINFTLNDDADVTAAVGIAFHKSGGSLGDNTRLNIRDNAKFNVDGKLVFEHNQGDELTLDIEDKGSLTVSDSFIATQMGGVRFTKLEVSDEGSVTIGKSLMVTNTSGTANAELEVKGTTSMFKVMGNAYFTNNNATAKTFIDLNGGEFLVEGNNGLNYLATAADDDGNIAVNNAKLTVSNADLNMNNQAAGQNMSFTSNNANVDISGEFNFTNDGGAVVSLTANNGTNIAVNGGDFNMTNTASSSDNLTVNINDSKLEVKTDINISNAAFRADFNADNGEIEVPNDLNLTANGGTVFRSEMKDRSELEIGNDYNFVLNAANDASYNFNNSTVSIAGNMNVSNNGLTDDFNGTMTKGTLEVKGLFNVVNNSSASLSTNADLSIVFTDSSDVTIGNDVIIDHRTGRNATLRFSGNTNGFTTADLQNNIQALNNNPAGTLTVSVDGNSTVPANSAKVTVAEDINLSSISTTGATRIVLSRMTVTSAKNLSLDYNAAGNIMELEMNHEAKLLLSKDLTLDAIASGDVRIDMNGTSNLCIEGNILRPSNYGYTQNASTSTISYVGSSPQVLPEYDAGAGDLFVHANVLIDNAADLSTANGTARVTDTMIFREGLVNTFMNSDVHFIGARAKADSASHSSHINGPATKTREGAFVFPVGNSGWFGPIGISDAGNSADFTAQYYHNVVPVDTGDRVPTLTNISHVEYWDLDRNSGSSSAYVTLYYEHSDTSYINDLGDIRVARYDGNTWQDEGQIGTTNFDIFKGSVTSRNPIGTFSPFTFGSNSLLVNALPVEWLGFEVTKLNSNEASIEWSTGAEYNSKHFEIQRSIDGSTFETIATQTARGNSNSLSNYLAMDHQIANLGVNKIYYRIKQVDQNGAFEFTQVKSISLMDAQGVQITAMPNPATNNLNINLTNSTDEIVKVEVKLYNMAGQLVRSLSKSHSNNEGAIQLDIQTLPAGIYSLQVNSNGQVEQLRIIKK